jgi:hypothetical protein
MGPVIENFNKNQYFLLSARKRFFSVSVDFFAFLTYIINS